MKVTIIPSKTLLPQYALDPAFYDGVRNAKPDYALVERSVIPPNNGKGFEVKKGQLFRIIQETGPQVVDVALWNIHDNPGDIQARAQLSNRGMVCQREYAALV